MRVDVRAEILNSIELSRTVRRLAHEIAEAHAAVEELLVIGIRQGGTPLAKAVAEAIHDISKHPVGGVASVDVGSFRDDRPRSTDSAAKLEFDAGHVDLDGHVVVLIDDVIQTGRTLRAALDAVTSIGRPAAIESLVLIDRGCRELPVRPNYVGKNIPASRDGWVEVHFTTEGAGAYLVKR